MDNVAISSLPYATDDALSVLELLNDRSAASAEPSGLVRVVHAASSLGRREAIRWKGSNLTDELQRAGVEVRCMKSSPNGKGSPVRLAALMVFDRNPGKERHVDLFLDEIARKQKALAICGIEMSLEELVEMHLAHEFYHFVEFFQDRRTVELMPEVRMRGRWIGRHRRLERAGEVGAHAFAKEWTGAVLHPILLDAIVQMVLSGAMRDDFEGRVRRAWEILEA